RAAGPAGVHQHDPLVPGIGRLVLDPRHRELDLGAARAVVVQGHRQVPAFHARIRHRRVRAGAPLDMCDVVGRCRRPGPRPRRAPSKATTSTAPATSAQRCTRTFGATTGFSASDPEMPTPGEPIELTARPTRSWKPCTNLAGGHGGWSVSTGHSMLYRLKTG